MRVHFLFAAGCPLVILTSYDNITKPELLKRLTSKGIAKFIAHEIPVESARVKYGGHFTFKEPGAPAYREYAEYRRLVLGAIAQSLEMCGQGYKRLNCAVKITKAYVVTQTLPYIYILVIFPDTCLILLEDYFAIDDGCDHLSIFEFLSGYR